MHSPGTQWIRAAVFTLSIVLLIAFAAGGDQGFFLLVLLAVIFGGVLAFYLIFPGSQFFSISLANCLAVYTCLFVFLVETNFSAASSLSIELGFALPVLAFIGGAVLRRRRIREIVLSRELRGNRAVAGGFLWLLPVIVISAAGFAVPKLALPAATESLWLLISMGSVAFIVLLISPSVSSFLLDTGLVFEQFFDRIASLVIPGFAFLTFYSLLVIVFACLYRMIDLYLPGQHFNFNGAPYAITFSDGLYFSIVSLSTLGYGDIAPASALVRALIALEVIGGILLLLFGFSEIMRYTQDKAKQGRQG